MTIIWYLVIVMIHGGITTIPEGAFRAQCVEQAQWINANEAHGHAYCVQGVPTPANVTTIVPTAPPIRADLGKPIGQHQAAAYCVPGHGPLPFGMCDPTGKVGPPPCDEATP